MAAPGGSLVSTTNPRVGASLAATNTRSFSGLSATTVLLLVLSKPGFSNLKLAGPGGQMTLVGVTPTSMLLNDTVAPGGSLLSASQRYRKAKLTLVRKSPLVN